MKWRKLSKENGTEYSVSDEAVSYICHGCGGDVRKSLNTVELCAISAVDGRVDLELAKELAAKLGDNVLAINGDGRNTDILVEENVKECDALVAVTSNSETNILTCVAAKRMGVPKTIAEVENIEYIKLAEGLRFLRNMRTLLRPVFHLHVKRKEGN